VRRSALALKLMTCASSGALAAALTTSLPEDPGGARNWDYRYCGLRDAGFTLYALAVLGYGGEARRFHDYLARSIRESLPRLQTIYGIGREHELTERVLDHLDGHGGSRPVRVGIGAHRQRQIDVYGQILDLALLYRSLGYELDEQYRRLLATFAEFVAAHWQEPDQGLWAMRGPPRHHVHGKLMSWVAMDRARQLFDDGRDWAALAARIRAEIALRAVDRERRHLAQGFDGGVDAAVLLAPMLGFPAGGGVLDQTIDSVEHALARGDFLRRYEGPDGLGGEEGAFLACSFWLVDAKLAEGRADEASALLGRLVRCANDVGLYAEGIDPHSGAFLGNFPQAFTHLALIGSAVNLQLHRRRGASALAGSYADRAGRALAATFGWHGLRTTLERSRRVARLRSSPASKLAWP
jgi:GH15 family glucan-1,4-alpha-glucosidase